MYFWFCCVQPCLWSACCPCQLLWCWLSWCPVCRRRRRSVWPSCLSWSSSSPRPDSGPCRLAWPGRRVSVAPRLARRPARRGMLAARSAPAAAAESPPSAATASERRNISAFMMWAVFSWLLREVVHLTICCYSITAIRFTYVVSY